MIHYAVVIPAYNEALTIRDVTYRALAQCKDVIVVDDGSTDDTAGAIADLSVVLLQNGKNLGKAASLWRGMQHAISLGATSVITLDADNQHQPEDIPRFLELACKHPDHIIIGSRMEDSRSFPRRRYIANRVANFWISWAAGYRIKDSQSGFRLYPSSLLGNRKLRVSTAHSFVFESEILIEAATRGYSSLALPISAIYKPNSRASHFRPVLDIVLITRMVAWRLISRGLYPWGLCKAFLFSHARSRLHGIGVDGFATLLLSNVAILLTAGLSLWWQWKTVYRIALSSSFTAPASTYYLVLGMRLQNSSIAPDYASRLTRAIVLQRQNPKGNILVLGGATGGSEISEAQAGKEYLIDAGVPRTCIHTDDTSRHTLENLREARALLGTALNSQIVLITNRTHLARCHAISVDLGMPHYLCAAEDELIMGLRTSMRMLREAYYLHWYYVGKSLSAWTATRGTF